MTGPGAPSSSPSPWCSSRAARRRRPFSPGQRPRQQASQRAAAGIVAFALLELHLLQGDHDRRPGNYAPGVMGRLSIDTDAGGHGARVTPVTTGRAAGGSRASCRWAGRRPGSPPNQGRLPDLLGIGAGLMATPPRSDVGDRRPSGTIAPAVDLAGRGRLHACGLACPEGTQRAVQTLRVEGVLRS